MSNILKRFTLDLECIFNKKDLNNLIDLLQSEYNNLVNEYNDDLYYKIKNYFDENYKYDKNDSSSKYYNYDYILSSAKEYIDKIVKEKYYHIQASNIHTIKDEEIKSLINKIDELIKKINNFKLNNEGYIMKHYIIYNQRVLDFPALPSFNDIIN